MVKATLTDIGSSVGEMVNTVKNVSDMCTSSSVGISVREMAQTDLLAPDKPQYSGLLLLSFSEDKQHVPYNRSKYDNKWNIRVFI